MKNKIPNDSIFKKKGFYVALYSCLGIVMVMALAVTFSNLTPEQEEPQVAQVAEGEGAEIEPAMNNDTSSYLDPFKQEGAQGPNEDNDGQDLAKKQPTQSQKPTASPSGGKGTSATPSAKPTATADSSESKVAPAPPPTPATSTGESSENSIEEPESEEAFNEFDGQTALAWPVEGEILMDYSDQHAIYDKTLNQYRTNDNICISADLGEQVTASADGVVLDVGKTEEDGNYIVLDHGNGWATTYSQLQDGVLVEEGDIVQEGQVIGGVASPSIYSVLLGNHIAFKVTHDGVSVDPKTLLG